jgi:glycosyltransferase involved in cell wall biosynthesis
LPGNIKRQFAKPGLMLQNKPVKKRKLKVGFDARMVAYRQAGIGQYCLNLLRELAVLQDRRDDFELTVYQSRKEKRHPAQWLTADPGEDAPARPGSVGGQRHPFKKRALWTPPHNRLEQVALPVEMLPFGPAVLHSPDFIPPLRRLAWQGGLPRPFASVITIHDLAFKLFPDLLTAESARYYGQIDRAAASAGRIIAVSQSTASDIVSRLGVSPDKVRVVYEAANPLYRPLDRSELSAMARLEAAGVEEKLTGAGIAENDRFALFVSTIEPRKNLHTLLQAYRRWLDSATDSQPLPKLVIAGREGWLYQDIYRQAAELRLDDCLVWLGGVETADLLYLYNRAAFLAMPSLYEGFGLPPLEALACGCPVLVAASSSLPEVVGDVGRTIPPQDVAAWSGALSQSWQDRDRLKNQALEAGVAWAGQFSWQRAAGETLAVYFEAFKQSGRQSRG